jgi:hypothetical protein
MTIDLQRCWSIPCRGCGKPLEGGPEDERYTLLFFAPGKAVETALDDGWTTDGRSCWCLACSLLDPAPRPVGPKAPTESQEWRLFCDHCGEEYEDPEHGRVVFETPAKAIEAALPEGWTTDGRRWHCDVCSEGEPLGEGVTWVHIPIPGQEALDV